MKAFLSYPSYVNATNYKSTRVELLLNKFKKIHTYNKRSTAILQHQQRTICQRIRVENVEYLYNFFYLIFHFKKSRFECKCTFGKREIRNKLKEIGIIRPLKFTNLMTFASEKTFSVAFNVHRL